MISKQGVTAEISHPKAGKSAGPDKIRSEMLKHVNKLVVDLLVELLNKLFDCVTFLESGRNQSLFLFIRKGM